MWIAALEAKYEQPESKSELLEPEYWDRILGDYNVSIRARKCLKLTENIRP